MSVTPFESVMTTAHRRIDRTESSVQTSLEWFLILPLIFVAVRGVFSFEIGPELAQPASEFGSRSLGFVGYVLIPGIAYSIVLWSIISRFGDVMYLCRRLKLLTALSVFCIFSAVWSQAPGRSALHGILYLVGTLFAYSLVARFTAEDIMRLITRTGTVIAVLNLMLIVIVPRVGTIIQDGTRWRGLFPASTGMAQCLAFLLTPALIPAYGRWTWKRIAYIGVLSFSILMTHTATAPVALLLYVILMLSLGFLRRLDGRALLAFVIALVVPLGTVLIAFQAQIADFALTILGRDPTLTGRTTIWKLLTYPIAMHPLLGYGFYAFWLGRKGASANVLAAAHWDFGFAHNGYLEIVLQLGFVGLAFFAITYFDALRYARLATTKRTNSGIDWYVGLLMMVLVYNLDEAAVLWPNDLLSILYIVACAGLMRAAIETIDQPSVVAEQMPHVHVAVASRSAC